MGKESDVDLAKYAEWDRIKAEQRAAAAKAAGTPVTEAVKQAAATVAASVTAAATTLAPVVFERATGGVAAEPAKETVSTAQAATPAVPTVPVAKTFGFAAPQPVTA